MEWFEEACKWLSASGVVTDNTRISQYATDLRKIAEYHEAGRIDELIAQRSFPDLTNSLVEAGELIDIKQGLGQLTDPNLENRLQEFVKGAALNTDERAPGNYPRNIGFELTIASACAAAGLPIDLRPPKDVWVSFGDHPVAIECKRPFSARKVESRIREGFKQLGERYSLHHDPSKAHGILALSITKLENDGSFVLNPITERNLNEQIALIIDRFIDSHKRHWERLADSRTIAVLLYLRAPAIIESMKLLTVARQFVFISLTNPSSVERGILERVAAPIGALTSLSRS